MSWPRIRIVAASAWTLAFLGWLATAGFSTERWTVLFWVLTALVAFTAGNRRWWQAPVDWAPIIVFFLAYDWTRGHAGRLGRPIVWDWQIRADRFLGMGRVPTVWLQSRLASPTAHLPAWEVLVAATYLSHFVAPFVVGGALWVRRRKEFVRFMVRLACISAIGVACYVVVPAAPPWAAARCTAAEVTVAPATIPDCVHDATPEHPRSTLLPALHRHRPGYRPLVQRITARGWDLLPGLERTRGFVRSGIDGSNLVAAIPSLHGAGALLVSWSLWPLARRRWRPLLVAYPLMMAFSLVYGGDHYVVDILLGWLLVAAVMLGTGAVERRRDAAPPARRGARHAADATAPVPLVVRLPDDEDATSKADVDAEGRQPVHERRR